jgi:rhamnogalacturonan acetylesterase
MLFSKTEGDIRRYDSYDTLVRKPPTMPIRKAQLWRPAMKTLFVPVLLSFALCASLCTLAADSTETAAKPSASETSRKPTIFVCGDSTSKSSGRGKSGEQIAGWGTPIANYFDPAKVTINNVGHAGRSSRTYYDGDWPGVLPKIQSGDYVLLVFGINDGSTLGGIGDETREGKNGQERTYGWYMSKMTTDAKEKGAHVYLLTVTTRNMWTNPKAKFRDATPTEALPADYDAKEDRIERGTGGGRFTKWTKEIGEKLHVPVFDLTNYCADKYEAIGRENVDKLYSDHNHTYMPGADTVASCIVSGLKAFKDSPFTALLSEKGRALPTADAKYASDNSAP